MACSYGDFYEICQTAKLKAPPNEPRIWYLLCSFRCLVTSPCFIPVILLYSKMLVVTIRPYQIVQCLFTVNANIDTMEDLIIIVTLSHSLYLLAVVSSSENTFVYATLHSLLYLMDDMHVRLKHLDISGY